MIIEDFNAQNSLWDKHCKSSSKLGVVLEDNILRHGLYGMTLTRGIKNISIKTLNIEETNIKTRHKAIVIHLGENNVIKILKPQILGLKMLNGINGKIFLKTFFKLCQFLP